MILRKEAELYRSLKPLVEEQKKFLLSGKVELLPENVRKQEKILFSLQPIVEKRRAWMAQEEDFRNSLKTDAELQEAFREVQEAAKALDRLQRENEKLLENAKEYVEFTLRTLAGEKEKPVGTKEKKPEVSRPAFLDRVV